MNRRKVLKVRELVIELLDYNMDALVTTNHSETVSLGFIGSDCSDKKSTPFVFIDGCDLVDSSE